MRRYTDRCEGAIRETQAQSMVDNTSQIARLGNRVLMAAKNEADNSEEPAFVQRVNTAASQLHSGRASIFIKKFFIDFYSFGSRASSFSMGGLYARTSRRSGLVKQNKAEMRSQIASRAFGLKATLFC